MWPPQEAREPVSQFSLFGEPPGRGIGLGGIRYSIFCRVLHRRGKPAAKRARFTPPARSRERSRESPAVSSAAKFAASELSIRRIRESFNDAREICASPKIFFADRLVLTSNRRQRQFGNSSVGCSLSEGRFHRPCPKRASSSPDRSPTGTIFRRAISPTRPGRARTWPYASATCTEKSTESGSSFRNTFRFR